MPSKDSPALKAAWRMIGNIEITAKCAEDRVIAANMKTFMAYRMAQIIEEEYAKASKSKD